MLEGTFRRGAKVLSRSLILEEIWEKIKDQIPISKEEFFDRVTRLARRLNWKANIRALAIVVAKELGADVSSILVEPKKGRILEVGPVRITRSRGEETPYCIFVLVNEDERLWCVVFGAENVEKVRQLEEKPVLIENYTLTSVRGRTLLRVTERSKITELDEEELPPILQLKPAWAENLKSMTQARGAFIVSVLILEEEIMEYPSCPYCKRSLDMTDSEWLCSVHGPIDQPEMRKVYHYFVADDSGTYPAVFFGDPPQEGLAGKRVILKGYFKDSELQIMKFYEIEEVEEIEE